jgi:hypothetical protein
MAGLKMFAQGVEPGSAKLIAATGDRHNALLLVTVRASFAPGAPTMTLGNPKRCRGVSLLGSNPRVEPLQHVFWRPDHATAHLGRCLPQSGCASQHGFGRASMGGNGQSR